MVDINTTKPQITEEELQYEYNFFKNEFKYLKGYMKKNLDKMPNNKGYIYNGIQYYGKCKANPKHPLILFEKLENSMLIHEITEYTYKKFEKDDNGKKCIFSKSRRQKRLLRENKHKNRNDENKKD
ncbi:unnamed protein product [marine sediment metagenome]|uniref:Uncharacterized protein n=1 Tax=marine sediment metagenome TaxID=412755 RepID=X0SD87_9ZZZZ